ncbi:MAG: lactate utilization protein [Calditrichaeota bacterium]|nr:lactate utilization protein [Calditrichota bacterium]
MRPDPRYFDQNVRESLADEHLQVVLRKACDEVLVKRAQMVAEMPHWERLREAASRIKAHVMANLDTYLLQLERNLTANGVKVHWARDAEEARSEILDIARKHNVWTAVKSKSMTSEEIGLNPFLEQRKIRPVETDLGEYIQQLSGEPPFHIVTPAMHRSRQDVGRIFAEKLGVPYTEDPESLTRIARDRLRSEFLSAEMGISGANFAVAETGTIVIVENEGNARLTTTAPKVHVAVLGIEKVIPSLRDLRVFLNLLSISSTAQRLPCYVNLIRSPRREGEHEGPEEVHVVLLDNGRTEILTDDEMVPALHCIRCGACLNVCPIFQRAGGHAYGWVPGPDRVDSHPALPGAGRGVPASFRVFPLWGLLGDMPGQNRHSPHAAWPARQDSPRAAGLVAGAYGISTLGFRLEPPLALPAWRKDVATVPACVCAACTRAASPRLEQNACFPAPGSTQFPPPLEAFGKRTEAGEGAGSEIC